MYANLFTFVAFRIFPLAYLTYGIFYDGHRVPLWFLRFYATSMATVNVINAVLLYRVLRADFWSVDGAGRLKLVENADDADQYDIDKSAIGTDLGNSLHRNGLRLRDNVDHIMKHVVQNRCPP